MCLPEIICRSVSDGHNKRYAREFTADKKKAMHKQKIDFNSIRLTIIHDTIR